MSSGVSAHGTFLLWNWHKVLELSGLSGPSETRETIDITSHDSDDKYKEFIAGVGEGGEVSLEGNLITGDTNGQIAFHTDVQNGTKRTAYIVLPMTIGQASLFSAIAKGFTPDFPYDDKMSVSGSLQVTGKPTLLTTQSTGMSALTGHEYDGAVEGSTLSISPAVAAGTYAYTCEVTDSDQDGVKLAVTAASHTIYVQGASQTSGVEGDTISLGDAGTDTDILIVVFETDKSPRLYTLTVTRPSA